MSWQGIEGHDDVVEAFRRCLSRDRLASTFLFVGPEGIGKRSFALKLAQTLLCETVAAAEMNPCGRCPGCLQTLARSHPDLLLIQRPKDKNTLPVELFIGSRDQRGQEGLCHAISLKPMRGGRRVALIDDADYLAQEGANALLKTLEEPPPRSMLVLIGTSPEKQLPTIRSRCQQIRFRPLPPETLTRLLVQEQIAADAAEAERLAPFAEGSLAKARELSDPALWAFRGKLLEQLSAPRIASVALAAEIASFADGAGKEAGPRRARARQVMQFAVDYFHQLGRALAGVEVEGDEPLRQAVRRSLPHAGGREEAAAACVFRSLDATQHLDSYAAPATTIESWIDDVARTMAAGRPI